MKLSAWQLIALAGVLLAALICANVFAPGAVAAVTGIVTTLVALMVERSKEQAPKDPPDLKVLEGGASKDGPQ